MDRSVPTCTPQEQIVDIAARLATSSSPVCVVVNDHRVVQGRLRRERVSPGDTRPAEDVMEPGPTTIRADADLAETLERMITKNATSVAVTTPDGMLLGALHNNAGSE